MGIWALRPSTPRVRAGSLDSHLKTRVGGEAIDWHVRSQGKAAALRWGCV